MKARDIMTVGVVTASEDSTLQSIVESMMAHHISAVPIVDAQQRLLGIVSEGDLMNRPEAETYHRRSWWLRYFADPERRARDFLKSYGTRAADVMTRTLVTVGEDESVASVAEKLEHHRIKRVPVVRDGRLVGIVTRANLLQSVGSLQRGDVPAADSTALREALYARLEEAGIRGHAINVLILPDTVELWGVVDYPIQVEAAQAAAASLVGTRQIVSHLTVLDPHLGGGYAGI